MGLLDNFAGQTGSSGATSSQNTLVSALISLLANQNQGGLSGLIQRFSGSGLGDIVNSWVSTGDNKPVTPQQVQQGLGQDTIGELSSRTGMAPDVIKTQLSSLLPQVVDRLTPEGRVPPQGDLMSQGMNMLKGLF